MHAEEEIKSAVEHRVLQGVKTLYRCASNCRRFERFISFFVYFGLLDPAEQFIAYQDRCLNLELFLYFRLRSSSETSVFIYETS